jgi:hypothetical protein
LKKYRIYDIITASKSAVRFGIQKEGLSVDRREQLLKTVAPISANGDIALKYANHLEELFDVIVPERIGENFCAAIKKGDFVAAVGACAKYYREKPDFTVSELSGKGYYNIKWAENCVKGMAREVNIDWTFPNAEIDFLFDPTRLTGTVNHEWLWQFNRHEYWRNMAVGTRE